MAWRAGDPVTLPDGRLVCRPHRLVVCGYCTVDYSFMDELIEDNVDAEASDLGDHTDDIDGPPLGFIMYGPPLDVIGSPMSRAEPRAGTGRVFPTKFNPSNPSNTPQMLFPLRRTENAAPPVYRFIRRNDETQFLIYTDGACLGNGGANPRAEHPQTSNRAELRAVIAAMRFRVWTGEGCRCLVIATDSEYVVEGMTKWVKGWIRNNWKTSSGAPVKSKDLWECLLGEVERWDENGMRIQFWRIPREWTTEADQHAKVAATKNADREFQDIHGFLV
ncbi:hypothetical protein PENFLA_c013G09265 [Penicillium flavigenum]|uniref:ribonuclease H n=1 Tax=Penicillium flavigenum TaxID=254877 RepID=A0A1V6T7M8_9EURO|nr:hypothetical protein PENFLA_c013G09265 [Penicillium flavigenum]